MLKRAILNALVGFNVLPAPALVAMIVKSHPRPEDIKNGSLVLVKGKKGYKWACFKCPGGCGVDIKLSLSPQQRPRWSVNLNWLNIPTVTPSIRQTDVCTCHFWIKNGQIDWCSDSGKSRHH